MDIWFRVRFLVLKDDNWHQFCKRNYRLQKYTVNNTLHSLSRKHFDRLIRQYNQERLKRQYNQDDPNLDDLTERGFACKIQTPSGQFELVPREDFDLNFVVFVKKYEVNSRLAVVGNRIRRRLVVEVERYFVEKARMGFRGFPNPAHR